MGSLVASQRNRIWRLFTRRKKSPQRAFRYKQVLPSSLPEGAAPEALTRPVETPAARSEEHTSELQSQSNLVCRLLLEKKKQQTYVAQVTRSLLLRILSASSLSTISSISSAITQLRLLDSQVPRSGRQFGYISNTYAAS